MTVVVSTCAAALVATTSAFVFDEPGVRYAAEALSLPRSLRRRSPLERSLTLLVLVLVVLAGLSPLAEDPASSPAALGVITAAALVWVSAGRVGDRPVASALLIAGAGWMLPSTVYAVSDLAATRDQATFPDLGGVINGCVVFVSPESGWSTVLAFLEFGPMAMIFAAPAVFAGAVLWLHRGAEAA
ncbi:hypothetical protein GCM10010435_13630 [Winogradskya consettensis]|uniref:Uncharacterized protein n=1 Tax=Winogradskya consettensis TaxID=113560 RepID=A0A919SAH4_9ACTN|nr:hypothetical protein [Actinoplanes consettensis]GIM68924.1 hypothetical protein Aco04nite_12900 [Actinoplanes consettensis]